MTAGEPLVLLPALPGADRYLGVQKPSGRIVHGRNGVLEEMRQRFGADVSLVHRLDKETSGVLLLARDAEALRAALHAWSADVTKTYVAVTRGVPVPAEGVVDRPLLEHRSGKPELLARAVRAAYGPSRAGHLLAGRRVREIPPLPPPGRTAAHPGGRPASTAYRVLRDDGATAVVELVPREGRMHQLRVHLAAIGTPILGDPLYDSARGPETPEPLLHAARLEWRDPPGTPPGTVWVWSAPAPRPTTMMTA